MNAEIFITLLLSPAQGRNESGIQMFPGNPKAVTSKQLKPAGQSSGSSWQSVTEQNGSCIKSSMTQMALGPMQSSSEVQGSPRLA